MTEIINGVDDHEQNVYDHTVHVEYGGYIGVGRIQRVGQMALKWQISIIAENGRIIRDFDGPEVHGEGSVIVTVNDIENVQHHINIAINQFIWDPMSQA